MKIKNRKNEKNIIQKKNPAKISWPMSAKYVKCFIQKEKKTKQTKNKKNRKLPWPMSAKSDT